MEGVLVEKHRRFETRLLVEVPPRPRSKTTAPSPVWRVIQNFCVCQAKTSNNFLGIDACRACAVFYRRAKNNGTELRCKSGRDNCAIYRLYAWACRKCRYAKIQEAIARSKEELQSSASTSQDSFDLVKESPSFYLDEIGPMRVGPILQGFRRAYNLLSDANRNGESSEPSSLARLTNNIRERVMGKDLERSLHFPMLRGVNNDCCRRRLELDFGDLESVPLNASGFIEAKAAFAKNTPEYMKTMFEAVFKMLCSASHEFAVLKREHQCLLLRNFLFVFPSLERCYHTLRRYSEQPNRIFAAHGHYMDLDNIEAFFENLPTNNNKEEIVRMTREVTVKNVSAWRPMAEKLAMTPEEFVALVALLLWDISAKAADEHLAEVAEKQKRELLHELHAYYRRQRGMTNYSSRLGELMLYLSTVETMVGNYAHIPEVFLIFDVIDQNHYDLAKMGI